MRTRSVPPPAPNDQAAERLISAVESAIAVMQERFANLTNDTDATKWSVSDLVRLLQLRNQLQAERPRNISVRWVDNPIGSKPKEPQKESQK